MPVPVQILQDIEENPEFAKLSYEDQTQVRAQILGQRLPQQEGWGQLDPAGKEQVFDALVFRPPIFAAGPGNTESAAGKPTRQQSADQWEALALSGKLGEPSNQRALQAAVGFHQAADSVAMAKLVYKAFEPIGMGIAAAGDLLAEGISRATGIPTRQDSDLTERFATERAFTRDDRKLNGYLQMIGQQANDERLQKKLNLTSTLAQSAGLMLDLAIGYGISEVIPAIGGARTVSALTRSGRTTTLKSQVFQRIADLEKVAGTTRMRAFMLGSVAPNVARATGTAAFGMIREVTQDLFKEGNLGPSFTDGLLRAGGHFGNYFAGDMIAFGALGALKGFGKGVLSVFGKSIRREKAMPFLRDVMQNAAEGKAIPDELLDQITNPAAREYVGNLPRAFRAAGNIEEMVPGSQGFADAAGVLSHHTIRKLDDGWRLIDIDTGKAQVVKTWDQAMDTMAKRIQNRGVLDESHLQQLAVNASRQASPQAQLSRTITSRSTLPVSNTEAIVRGLNPPSGVPNSRTVKNVAKAFFREAGGTGDEAASLSVKRVDDFFTPQGRARRFSGRQLEVPRSVANSDEAIEFQRRTIDRLAELSGGAADLPVLQGGRKAAQDIIAGLPEAVVARRAFSPAWVKFAAAKQLSAIAERAPGTSGSWQLRNQQGVLQTFGSFDELESFMFTRNLNQTMAKDHLQRQLNATLTRGKDGLWRVKDRASGQLLDPGSESLDDLFTKHPDWRPKLSHDLLPDVNLVDDNFLEVTHRQGILEGDLGSLRRNLDNFRDNRRGVFTTELPGPRGAKIKLDRRSQIYEVEVPELGYRKKFNTLKEAREFTRSKWREWDTLFDIAQSKHMDIVPLGDRLLVYERGKEGAAIIARNIDEVEVALKKVPTPEAAPELSGMSEDLVDLAQHPNGERIKLIDEVYEADFQNFRPKDDTTAWQDASTFWRPKEGVIRGMAQRTGQAGVENQFAAVQAGQRAMTALDGGARSDILAIARTTGGGKLPRTKRVREFTNAWRSGATPDDWNAHLRANGLDELNPGELEGIQQLDRTLGAFGEAEGIDLRNYMRDTLPKMRNTYSENPRAFLEHHRAQDLVKAVGTTGMPEGQATWDLYERLEDVVALSRKDNMFEQAMLSIHGVNRRNVLRPILDDTVGFINDNSNQIPRALREEMSLFVRDVTGLPTSMGEARLRDTTMKFGLGLTDQLKKWGWLSKVTRADKIMMGDTLSALMSFSSTATMGFRAFLPVRNMFQVFHMLGSRIGIAPVFKAMRKVAEDGDNIVEKMRRGGIIQNLETFGMGVEGIRRNLTNVSLGAYRNSDTWTRAVAYTAAEDMLSSALKKQRAGVLRTTEDFVNLSGLDMMDRNVRQRILQAIDGGQERAAIDMLGAQLVNETMFAYQKAMSPRAFRGIVGKLFGQYGTYPVWYTENVLRGITRGSLSRRAAFVARWGATTLGIYGGMRAVFGVNAPQFLPWQPMMFTGGPYFTTLTRLLGSVGSHPEAKMNRAAILRELPRVTVPGHAVLRNLGKVGEALDQGNFYEAVLIGTTAPYRPEITRITDPRFSLPQFFSELGR